MLDFSFLIYQVQQTYYYIKNGAGGGSSRLWYHATKLTGKMYFHQSIFLVIVDHHKKYTYLNSTQSIRREKTQANKYNENHIKIPLLIWEGEGWISLIWDTWVQFSIQPPSSFVKLSHFHLDPQKRFNVGLVQAAKDADANVYICPKKRWKSKNTQVYVNN